MQYFLIVTTDKFYKMTMTISDHYLEIKMLTKAFIAYTIFEKRWDFIIHTAEHLRISPVALYALSNIWLAYNIIDPLE